MKKKLKKVYLQQKKRYLKKIVGSAQKPRLSVFRSHQHIYAQLINDQISQTLIFSSTRDKEIRTELTVSTATQAASFLVGQNLAIKAKAKNISTVIFDRGNRPYHGRIQKLAEGARESGLQF